MSEGDDIFGNTKLTKRSKLFKKSKKPSDTPPAILVVQGQTETIGKFWLLTDPEYSIGRSPENTVFIDDQSVSRSHAHVQIFDSQVIIKDLGSSNSTTVNGVTLKPRAPYSLKNNDEISCGDVVLKFLERGNSETEALIRLQERVGAKNNSGRK